MKYFFILSILIFSNIFFSSAFASVLIDSKCVVTAEVVANDTIKVLSTNDLNYCNFIKTGEVFRIQNGNNVVAPASSFKLIIGDKIESKVSLSSTMGPSGAINFIQWGPITSINNKRTIPSDFFVQSNSKPEPQYNNTNKTEKLTVVPQNNTINNPTTSVESKSPIDLAPIIAAFLFFGIALFVLPKVSNK